MITILLQKILAALTQLLGDIKTKLNTIKDNLDNLIVVATASGPIASFTTTITKPLISCKVEIKPKQASGTPTPSSPLPISGTDTVIVTQTGANFWDEEWELGSISTTTGQPVSSSAKIRSKNFIPIKASTSFCIMTENALADTDYLYFYDINQNYISSVVWKSSQTGLRVFVFTSPSNAYYMKFVNKGTTYGNDISINYPSTDTAYHAHVTATTKTVSLPQTVYGGEVDVIGGSGKVTHKLFTFTGSETWSFNSSNNFFYTTINSWRDAKQQTGLITDNGIKFRIVQGSQYANIIRVYIADNSDYIDSSTDMKTILTNVTQFAYELVTPTPITLANPIELTVINGVNNVFGDTDGNTTVEYLKLYKEV